MLLTKQYNIQVEFTRWTYLSAQFISQLWYDLITKSHIPAVAGRWMSIENNVSNILIMCQPPIPAGINTNREQNIGFIYFHTVVGMWII